PGVIADTKHEARANCQNPGVTEGHLNLCSRGLYGSDLMVEVLRALGIRYIALNPGASYRGMHDSLVNFGQGEPPEIILCTHEELAETLAAPVIDADGRCAFPNSHALDLTATREQALRAAFGPITEPDQLGPTLDQAIEVVQGGKPAVVDVVTQ